jgi:hypothetical protein
VTGRLRAIRWPHPSPPLLSTAVSEDPTSPDSDDSDTFDLAEPEPVASDSGGLAGAYAADAAGSPMPAPGQPSDAPPPEVTPGQPSVAAGWNDPANQPPAQDPAVASRRREDSRKEAAIRLGEADAKARKVKLIIFGVLVVVGIILWQFVF